jgi:hypothetical protein
MSKRKNPAGAWTIATGNNPKKTASNNNAEEVDVQFLASALQPGESVQIAPGLWFTIPIPLQFDPDPAPEGWMEEFGRVHVHPRFGDILFHRAFFEGPADPWQNLSGKEAWIALSEAWNAYPQLRPMLTFLAFKAWRFTSIRPLPDIMNEEVGALWKLYSESGKERPK